MISAFGYMLNFIAGAFFCFVIMTGLSIEDRAYMQKWSCDWHNMTEKDNPQEAVDKAIEEFLR